MVEVYGLIINFSVRTCVKFTFADEIEAMHESPLVSVNDKPRSTSRLSSALFILPLFYFLNELLMSLRRYTSVHAKNDYAFFKIYVR